MLVLHPSCEINLLISLIQVLSSTVIAGFHPIVTTSRELLVNIMLCWFLLESYISGAVKRHYRLFLSALVYLYVVFLVVDSLIINNLGIKTVLVLNFFETCVIRIVSTIHQVYLQRSIGVFDLIES